MAFPNHPPLAWAKFLKKTRDFFEKEGFLEVSTPCLVGQGAFEHALDPLSVKSSRGNFELHTSPEFEMKALLAEHKDSIYQISHCFRDDPDTGIHFLEFHMLEFYRVKATYLETQKDMVKFFEHLAGKPLKFERYSISEIFEKETGIVLKKNSDLEKLPVIAGKLVHVGKTDTPESVYFKMVVDIIEPSLPKDTPVILYDFPASISTLSKSSPQGWGERFEIYWKGMEICNGATELGDSQELRRRYKEECEARQKEGKKPHEFPEKLANALDKLPPCSGVAVGLDRLFWGLQGTAPLS